jgi:hypothetical protein
MDVQTTVLTLSSAIAGVVVGQMILRLKQRTLKPPVKDPQGKVYRWAGPAGDLVTVRSIGHRGITVSNRAGETTYMSWNEAVDHGGFAGTDSLREYLGVPNAATLTELNLTLGEWLSQNRGDE